MTNVAKSIQLWGAAILIVISVLGSAWKISVNQVLWRDEIRDNLKSISEKVLKQREAQTKALTDGINSLRRMHEDLDARGIKEFEKLEDKVDDLDRNLRGQYLAGTAGLGVRDAQLEGKLNVLQREQIALKRNVESIRVYNEEMYAWAKDMQDLFQALIDTTSVDSLILEKKRGLFRRLLGVLPKVD